MKLGDGTVLITGGSAGIGLALAGELHARGCEVVITGRDAKKLEAAKARFPGLSAIRGDLSSAAAVEALATEALARFPKLQVLINNAGVMHEWDVRSAPLGIVDEELATNLAAPIKLTRLLLPRLLEHPDPGLMMVSSGVAYVPMAQVPVYSATKAALHSFTSSLREQLRGTRLTVCELLPPRVESAMTAGKFGKTKLMSAETCARKAVNGLLRGEAEVRPGESYWAVFGARFFPTLSRRMLANWISHPTAPPTALPLEAREPEARDDRKAGT